MPRNKGNGNEVEGNNLQADGNILMAGGDIYYEAITAEQITELFSKIQRKPFDGRNPYKGLAPFEEEDAEFFFGRKKLVDELVRHTKMSRRLFITGPSGSGKSSVVRAGLLRALKQGTAKSLRSQRWKYATIRPGRAPLDALAAAFSRLKDPALEDYFLKHLQDSNVLNECVQSVLSERDDERLVLFIDQFEEIFTQVPPKEAYDFIHILKSAADLPASQLMILTAMRSDFLPDCAAYPELNALLNGELFQVPAMKPEELASAIEEPALHVGLDIEPKLVERIINDMKGEPGDLPLMQFALNELVEAGLETNNLTSLTLQSYVERGGVQTMLARHADSVLQTLSEGEVELARTIFSGLIGTRRGEQDTGQTAFLDQLVPDGSAPANVRALVQKLADARLVTTDIQSGKEVIRLSHEKLIDAWPWLKQLVDENLEAIALRNEITMDAQEWQRQKQDPSYLYSGVRLTNMQEQLAARKLQLNGTPLEFMDASTAQAVRNRQARVARVRALAGGVGAFIVLLILAVILFRSQSGKNLQLAQQNLQIASTAQAASMLAVAQEATAEAERNTTRAGEWAALALTEKDSRFSLASLFGVEGFRALQNPRTEGTLLTLTGSHPGLDAYLSGHTDMVESVAFSPDGKVLATASADRTVMLWDATNPKAPIRLAMLTGHKGELQSVSFSPVGNLLASGDLDKTLILWDVREPRNPIRLAALPVGSGVLGVAFSPDAHQLASSNLDNSIILWDISDPRNPVRLAVLPSVYSESVSFSPDGKLLASGITDGTVILWNVGAGKTPTKRATLSGQSSYVDGLTFSPDSRWLASGSRDGSVILWDVSNSSAPVQLSTLLGYRGAVHSVSISPDGHRLASSGVDGTAVVWDLSDPRKPYLLATLAGHSGTVFSVAFNPADAGKTLVTGSADRMVAFWDVGSLATPAELAILSGAPAAGLVAFSPDGTSLSAGSQDNTPAVWNVADPTHPSVEATLPGHSDLVYSVAFSAKHDLLAAGSNDHTIMLWNVSDPRAPVTLATLSGHTDWVDTVAFSPDGNILASGSYDKTVILWDVADPNKPARLATLTDPVDVVFSVAISPDGKRLAVASKNNTVVLWDISDPTAPKLRATLRGHRDAVYSVAFSPDGLLLASGSWDGTIILWDVSNWDVSNPGPPPQLSLLSTNADQVESVAFSPDSKLLASAGADRRVIVWDVSQPLLAGKLATLLGHTSGVSGVAFSPNGKRLASASWDKTVILWDLDPESWMEKTCQRAGRNFTREEWAQYFPGEKYRATCPQWPPAPQSTTADAP